MILIVTKWPDARRSGELVAQRVHEHLQKFMARAQGPAFACFDLREWYSVHVEMDSPRDCPIDETDLPGIAREVSTAPGRHSCRDMPERREISLHLDLEGVRDG